MSKYNRKVSYEMDGFVEGSGEGWHFLWLDGATGAAENDTLEPLASALGIAAFLHNVIIVHELFLLVGEEFFMHYNATLCN